MKVWITRYALTVGILEVDAEISEGMASFKRTLDSYTEYAHGKDWHQTKDQALIRAGEMKIAKLQSLEKQIKKVSKITFEAKP
jgi:hypothetical protein